MSTPQSEHALLPLLQQKEPRAWLLIYEKYGGALQSLITDIVPDKNESGEILKDCFLASIQNIDSYDPAKSRLFTWLMQNTREMAIQKLRSSAVRTSIGDAPMTKKTSCFDGLFNNLDQQEQELVKLSYFEGYSPEALAKKLNLSIDAVKRRTKMALLQLNVL